MALNLTAIVCNYNYGTLLPRALNALLQSQRPPDEIIVVDDGSTDDSRGVITEFAARESTIRVIWHEQNRGWHAGTAGALAIATGDWIYSGAADDYVLPGFFAKAMALAEAHPHLGIVQGQVVSVDPAGRELCVDGLEMFTEPVVLTPARYLHEVLDVIPPTHSLASGTLFRRDALNAVGGMRVELGSFSDTFAIRTLGLREGAAYLPERAAVWLVAANTMSQTTRSHPERAWRIAERAAALMRSAAFREIFPADHVDRWQRSFQRAVVREQLKTAIDGYQAVQACSREQSAHCGPVTRLFVGLLRRLMTAAYLLQFRLLERSLAARIRQQARDP